ncbi:unnamed protein product [Menidia menidia]|uniref:(Atlantic silverside) hypothetical protein n=1 Tax=Menidia menidia TaxID=238744 RepID=A0A8S4ARC3_9TELE|nr:unnamed protein product [Menidia menidia]
MKRVTTKRRMRGIGARWTDGGMTAMRCFLWSLVLCSLSWRAQGGLSRLCERGSKSPRNYNLNSSDISPRIPQVYSHVTYTLIKCSRKEQSGFIYTCGGTLKGRNGSIESPGFPYGYPNGANCTWVIVGEERSRIQLIFLSFAIEEEYDFLSLYDGHPHPANFRSRLTGFQIPAPVTSTGNVFSLRLTSDFAVSAHGFKLSYEELHSTSCGNPGVPPKAVLSGGGHFAVGDSVRYSCVPGYVLDGHATLTCITNAGNIAVWDFPAPICRGSYYCDYPW